MPTFENHVYRRHQNPGAKPPFTAKRALPVS